MSQHKRPHYHSTISLLGLYYKKHLPSGWIHIFLRVVDRVARPPSAKGDIQIWTVFSHHPIKSGIPIFNVFTYKYHSSKWYTSSHHMSHHSNKSGIPSLQQEWYSITPTRVVFQFSTCFPFFWNIWYQTYPRVIFREQSDIPDTWGAFIHSHIPLTYSLRNMSTLKVDNIVSRKSRQYCLQFADNIV